MKIWQRRVLLIATSFAIGFGVTYLIVYLKLNISDLQLTLDTTFAEYGLLYTIITICSLAVAAGVWLDKLLDTRLIER